MGIMEGYIDLSFCAIHRQRDKLEDFLRTITTDRTKIGDLMYWCIDHADCCEEVSFLFSFFFKNKFNLKRLQIIRIVDWLIYILCTKEQKQKVVN